jgi:hypothetical protein
MKTIHGAFFFAIYNLFLYQKKGTERVVDMLDECGVAITFDLQHTNQ